MYDDEIKDFDVELNADDPLEDEELPGIKRTEGGIGDLDADNPDAEGDEEDEDEEEDIDGE